MELILHSAFSDNNHNISDTPSHSSAGHWAGVLRVGVGTNDSDLIRLLTLTLPVAFE